MSQLFAKSEIDIKSEIFTAITGTTPKITSFNTGGIMRGFVEVVAKLIKAIYDLLNLVFVNAFVQSATGIWLDMKVAEVGLTRKTAGKTSGNILFGRNSSTSANIPIPAGSIVQTVIDSSGNVYRYITSERIVLQGGQESVSVPVVADYVGAAFNALPGLITVLVNPIAGIDYVTNVPGWIVIPGVDAESDDDLRNRYYLKWSEVSGGNLDAYRSWALSVAGVKQVEPIPVGRGGGTVDVIFTSATGMPTADLISQVEQVIMEKQINGVDVYVSGPDPVNTDLSVQLVLFPSSRAAVDVETDASNAVWAYFQALTIGQDIVLSDIVAVLKKISDVKDVVFSNPSENIQVTARQIAVLISLSITSIFAEEI